MIEDNNPEGHFSTPVMGEQMAGAAPMRLDLALQGGDRPRITRILRISVGIHDMLRCEDLTQRRKGRKNH
jgi:hypothetical protein